jgi:hypothetical protein
VNEAKRSFFDLSDQQPVTIPGVFAQFAHAFGQLNRGAELDGLEPGFIHLSGDREHHSGSHAVRPETLLPIAQGRIDKTNLFHVGFQDCFLAEDLIRASRRCQRAKAHLQTPGS